MTSQATGRYGVTGAVSSSLNASAERIRSSSIQAQLGTAARGADAGDALTTAQAGEGEFDGLG